MAGVCFSGTATALGRNFQNATEGDRGPMEALRTEREFHSQRAAPSDSVMTPHRLFPAHACASPTRSAGPQSSPMHAHLGAEPALGRCGSPAGRGGDFICSRAWNARRCGRNWYVRIDRRRMVRVSRAHRTRTLVRDEPADRMVDPEKHRMEANGAGPGVVLTGRERRKNLSHLGHRP